MKTFEERDHPMHAAGRLWTVAQLTITELPDGSLGISQAELRRVHRDIANAVCGAPDDLTQDELEFLGDVTDTSYAEIARFLDLDKSTLSKWRGRNRKVPKLYSLALKKWFWFKLFGDKMADQPVTLGQAANEAELLAHAKSQAIKLKLAARVSERRADAA